MNILVLNAGSSSQKMALYRLVEPVPEMASSPLWSATADWSHHPDQCEIRIKTDRGEVVNELISTEQFEINGTIQSAILPHLFNHLWKGSAAVIGDLGEIDLVGHRVVHGGRAYRASVVIDAAVKETIDRLSAFAPLHNPTNLAGIVAIEQILDDIPQVAVFDTAFHADLPLVSTVYPLPYRWFEQGIQRYGFHGISHDYCSQRSAQILGRDRRDLKLITCHLGNGCSLAAIRDGHSIDTTMGFTPLEGVMMGTRSGSIDPGILIHLLRTSHYTVEQLDRILNHESGLLGVSGKSGDMRHILTAIDEQDPRAKLAFDVYTHRLRSQIGAMWANLGGLDALVFTAGVGEHAPLVRSAVCEGLAFWGIQIDPQLNDSPAIDRDIATPSSAVRVVVVQTQEDWAIALECFQLRDCLTR